MSEGIVTEQRLEQAAHPLLWVGNFGIIRSQCGQHEIKPINEKYIGISIIVCVTGGGAGGWANALPIFFLHKNFLATELKKGD